MGNIKANLLFDTKLSSNNIFSLKELLERELHHSRRTSDDFLSNKNIPDSAFTIVVNSNMIASILYGSNYPIITWNLNNVRVKCGYATCYDAFMGLIEKVNSKYGRHLPCNEDR